MYIYIYCMNICTKTFQNRLQATNIDAQHFVTIFCVFSIVPIYKKGLCCPRSARMHTPLCSRHMLPETFSTGLFRAQPQRGKPRKEFVRSKDWHVPYHSSRRM